MFLATDQLNQNNGVEKRFPTPSAIRQHILRAHYQAHIWAQDKTAFLPALNAVGLGWQEGSDGKYIPVLSDLPPAPEAVVELVKCSCGVSKCSRKYSCKVNNLTCTDLCKCEATEGTCTNLHHTEVQNDDLDYDEHNE